jgi:hypothetical protein
VSASLALAVTLACAGHVAEGFEPTELLQWNQGFHLRSNPPSEEPALRVEPSWRYFIWNEVPAQIGTGGDKPAKHEFDLRLQYRLIDASEWGKVELYFGSAYLTVEDVTDRLNITAEIGYTLWDKVRLEFGQFQGLNVGRKNPPKAGRLGASQIWLGGSYKLFQREDLLFDVYGRYFVDANTEATPSTRIDASKAIQGEVGARAYYRLGRYVIATVAPYMLFDTGIATVGAYPELRYNLGEHAFGDRGDSPLRGFSLELGANVNQNFKEKNALWIRIVWELR